MKYLSRINKNLKNQVCLLRIDLNIEAGQEKNALRIKTVIPTIKFLIKRGAGVVLLSHRGRPKKPSAKLSLRPFVNILSALLGRRIKFISGFNFKKIKKEIESLKPGGVILLENLRFLPEEEKNSRQLAKKLAELGDFYVNDAFAVSHRANASVAAIAKFLPSYAGLLLEKEVKNLDRIFKNPRRPLVLIIGGAKISGKIDLIKTFLKRADKILVGGGIANTLIAAEGLPIGESIYESKFIKLARNFLRSSKIKIPVDFIVSDKKILDIGPQTVNLYSRFIKTAKTIVWNGPLGLIENKKFAKGSAAIAKAIAKSRAFSLVGGGETSGLIIKIGLEKKISFLSTGGGAMLEYLSGKQLPGLKALK